MAFGPRRCMLALAALQLGPMLPLACTPLLLAPPPHTWQGCKFEEIIKKPPAGEEEPRYKIDLDR